MTSTPPTTPSNPLSLYVLLPASAHSNHQATSYRSSASRPYPLISRQSGSTIPSFKTLSSSRPKDSSTNDLEETPEIDKIVNAGRRLSLAPGIGTGTQIPSSHAGPSRLGVGNGAEPEPIAESSSTGSGAPAFGAKAPGGGKPSRRRPQTAANSQAALPLFPPATRGSVLPNGSGGRSRPGWEGDEVVGMLRQSGLEVTIIRHAAQIPSILSSSSSSPQLAHFNQLNSIPPSPRSSTPTLVTPVVLVPLSDSPTIPSLSLLLQQGTTPTAVCFQQDLLDRAKRTEQEWLLPALQQIRQVVEMRDHAQESKDKSTTETPIILAYSANPTLSPSTVAACVNAGASGVLKPPYDLDTVRLVRRMVRAAKEGRISSIGNLPNPHGQRSVSPNGDETPVNVVLPPTALSTGGEHEGERILSGAHRIQHRRGTSANLEGWAAAAHSGRQREASLPVRKPSLKSSTPIAIPTSTSIESVTTSSKLEPSISPDVAALEDLQLASWLVYNPHGEQRRRSVDVAGLDMALRRAQRAFEVVQKTKSSRFNASKMARSDEIASANADEEHGHGHIHDDEVCADTQWAELLGAMFYQTQLATEIDMDKYQEYSAPLTNEDRNRLVDAVETWDFKPHMLDDGDLFRVACLLFEGLLHSEGLADLQLGRDQINRLLFAIRAIYHAPNPYHNYVHAIDVLQATYSFLIGLGLAPPYSYIRDIGPHTVSWRRPTETDIQSLGPGSRRARQVFRPQDVFAIVIAAMGHDVGHPGLSNAFMKNARTPLSKVYDDKSVLENMHCLLIVQLLRKHGFGFLLSNRDSAKETAIPARRQLDTKAFRQVLYSSVLATDMSLHFVWMQTLQNYGEKVSQESGVYGSGSVGPGLADDDSVEADRIMLAQALIKCADISNPTRPIDVSEHWSSVLLKEWAVQASLETDLALPVSVIASADAALQAKGQIGFIKLFTQPLFDAVSDVLPELQSYADLCAANQELWENRSEKLKESDSSIMVQPVVEDASADDRFSTLFPLSLPVSLVEARYLEPGPLLPSPIETETMDNKPNGTTSSPVTPVTPVAAKKHKLADGCTRHPESPSAKAMRAVYHANLLDQRHQLSSWTRGVPIPGLMPSQAYLGQRRSSTPAVVVSR